MTTLDTLLAGPQFATPQAEKERRLLPLFRDLVQHHVERCPDYARLVRLATPDYANATCLADLPYVPAALFKHRDLASVPEAAVRVTLRSSGTTGQAPSRIAVDDATARRQSRALQAVVREVLGPQRWPLLVLDAENLLQRGGSFHARAAGVLGFLPFGRDPVFALDADFALREDVVRAFLARHPDAPILLYGFTSIVWKHFVPAAARAGIRLPNALLVHGGGWKKLADEAVDAATFRSTLHREVGIDRIHDYYGMVEQMGSLFLEGDDGLYPPAFADVIVRDPYTWQPVPDGETGVIQVLSLVPLSYPGHSVLTEDLGRIVAVDSGAGGRLGKALHVVGRAPRAEIRGCSDTFTGPAR